MTTLAEAGQWALHFLLWFVPTGVMGALAYGIFLGNVRWLRILGGLVLVVYLTTGHLHVFIILPSVVVSIPQALIERDRARFSWWGAYGLAWLANVTSLLAAFSFVLYLYSNWWGLGSPTSFDFGGMWGYGAGALMTPLSISFFRWVIPTLRLRPGIDRSLDEGEVLP